MLFPAPDQRLDPFPFLARMRDEQPVAHDPRLDAWAVYRHADARAILKDFARFSSDPVHLPLPAELRDFIEARRSLVNTDPPRHLQLRHLVTPYFTPHRIARLQPVIAGIVDDLLAKVDRTLDVVADLAFPLPVMVIAESLGVPAEDRSLFKQWADILIGRSSEQLSLVELPPETLQVQSEMDDYFAAVLHARRASPRDDLISHWAAACAAGHLTEAEVLSLCTIMLLAGHVTTVNLIGNAVWTLLEHPQALAALRAEPNLVAPAIEEVLRYRSPIQVSTRITVTDVTVAGRAIPKGKMVFVWLASANRDEAVFADADRFDVRRRPVDHLAFGTGIHFCLGAQLARLEARVAIDKLLRRFADWRLVNGEVQRAAGDFLYGPERLLVAVDPAMVQAA